jgi:uncharacterized membrane protein YhaH (DUF805 family)
MIIKFSDLWRWDGTIGRRTYLLLGLSLFLVKFVLDRTISSFLFGHPWSILNYENTGAALSPTEDRAELLTLWAVSLPFLCSGVVLTLRRLRSAGLPLWLVVLFVVPMLKLVFFAILCLLPARESFAPGHASPDLRAKKGAQDIRRHSIRDAVFAICITLLLTVPITWLGTSLFQDYGWSLFVALPFCMGFASVLIYCVRRQRTIGACVVVALCTVGAAGLALLTVKIEGAICLLMAAPLVGVLAVMGGVVAFAIQSGCFWRKDSPKLFCTVILAVPFSMGLEHYQLPRPPLLEVRTSVIVNAPPERVWRNVVAFSELPPPREWLFLAGIAYPIRAEIHGHGPGAIRYCNFSTGPFVEPIEVWDEPNLLKFSVTSNPAPMRELSPYHELHPAHMDGFLVSKEGQFHLVRLADGRTLLEGTTWYQHHLWPARYWQIWSNYIIHRIHLRVLNHVKELSENDRTIR